MKLPENVTNAGRLINLGQENRPKRDLDCREGADIKITSALQGAGGGRVFEKDILAREPRG